MLVAASSSGTMTKPETTEATREASALAVRFRLSVALPPVIVIALIVSTGKRRGRDNWFRCVFDSARCVWRCLCEPREHAQSDAKKRPAS